MEEVLRRRSGTRRDDNNLRLHYITYIVCPLTCKQVFRFQYIDEIQLSQSMEVSNLYVKPCMIFVLLEVVIYRRDVCDQRIFVDLLLKRVH